MIQGCKFHTADWEIVFPSTPRHVKIAAGYESDFPPVRRRGAPVARRSCNLWRGPCRHSVHGRSSHRRGPARCAHVSQIEMAGGEGRAEQWLAEGMAEWVAFTSLEQLGLDTLANRRALATAGIRNHAALVAARLDLETLGNPRGFTVRHLKEGSLPTYQLAFLMADYLIERDGFPRVVDYFKSFERRQDRHSNFRDIFGQSLDQFEREVLAHLKTVVR